LDFGTGEEVLSGEKLVSYPFVARNNKLYFKTKTVPRIFCFSFLLFTITV
jgi:hypothetical protein